MRTVQTSRGTIYVRPGDPTRAIVYVHGYRTDAANAFRRVETLVPRGATLIVPAAPEHRDQAVAFPDLPELLIAAGVPKARTLAVGHSGGYRTLKRWLPTSPQLRQVALLDAAYGDTSDFVTWAKLPGDWKLFVVGGDSTRDESRALATRAGVPYIEGGGHQSVVETALPAIARQWHTSPWLWIAALAAGSWFIWG